jgi:hypothetical protein
VLNIFSRLKTIKGRLSSESRFGFIHSTEKDRVDLGCSVLFRKKSRKAIG